jgi:hypothetical protein
MARGTSSLEVTSSAVEILQKHDSCLALLVRGVRQKMLTPCAALDLLLPVHQAG